MQGDKLVLDRLGWKTMWMEFSGGHRMAPIQTYENAFDWLLQQPGWQP